MAAATSRVVGVAEPATARRMRTRRARSVERSSRMPSTLDNVHPAFNYSDRAAIRPGSDRDPVGIRSGFDRGPIGVRVTSQRDPGGLLPGGAGRTGPRPPTPRPLRLARPHHYDLLTRLSH